MFQPVIPFSGTLGWSFLQRTQPAQQEAFEKGSLIARNETAFRDRIGSIETAEQLVADRQLLDVALTAFGLEEDIGNKFFIQKVLEEGVIDPGSLANRLSDQRYFELSRAFGFDNPFGPSTKATGFADEVLSAYKDRSFEIAVGNSDTSLRLVLGLDREIETITSRTLSDESMWFTMMATPPLRQVFEQALGLPTSIGILDIDRQLEIFREKSAQVFGSDQFADFSNTDTQEELTRLFLVRADLTSAPQGTTSGSVALALLQSSPIVSRL